MQNTKLTSIGLIAILLVITCAPVSASAKLRKDSKHNSKLSANTSANWSGYASTQGPFQAICGTWQVPKIKSGKYTSANATWVGIGGIKKDDLIQSGTSATINNGQIIYQAWVEMLPDAPKILPLSIKPKDTVTVCLKQIVNNIWQIEFTNNNTKIKYFRNEYYNSSLSSAEWIEEAPSSTLGALIPLDRFGKVNFIHAYVIQNGIKKKISQIKAKPIDLIDAANRVLAKAARINKKVSGFTVRRSKISGIQDFIFGKVKRLGSKEIIR